MLELGRSLTINSGGSPLVGPGEILISTLINHRLDCEDVANFHETLRLIVPVVGYLRSLMENSSNTMASIAGDNRVSLGFNVLRNDVSTLSVHSSGLARLDGLHQRLVGGLDKCP